MGGQILKISSVYSLGRDFSKAAKSKDALSQSTGILVASAAFMTQGFLPALFGLYILFELTAGIIDGVRNKKSQKPLFPIYNKRRY